MRLKRKGSGHEHFVHVLQVSSHTDLLMSCILLSRKMDIIALPQYKKCAFESQAYGSSRESPTLLTEVVRLIYSAGPMGS